MFILFKYFINEYKKMGGLWIQPSSAKTLCHIRLLLLLPVHISCYEQLNSLDFVWMFADRPALQFLAAVSRCPAESHQRHLLSSSTILLQNLSCLKSILPPSNDSLKMNVWKTDPPVCMSTPCWLSRLYLDQRWRLLERYLLPQCCGITRRTFGLWRVFIDGNNRSLFGLLSCESM